MAILIDQITLGDIKLVVLDSDPSVSPGFAAPQSSIGFVPSTGSLYAKFAGNDVDWTAFVGGTTSIEYIQDVVGALLQSSAEIIPMYNDAGNVETFALAVTTVTAGTYGSASAVAQFTVDSKGRITNAVNVPIAITSTQVTDFSNAAKDAALGALVDSAEIDFTYSSGPKTATAVLFPTTVTAGSYGTASSVPSISVDAKGRLTAAANTPIAITASQVTDFSSAVLIQERVVRGTVATTNATATTIASRTITGTTLLKAFVTATRTDTGATAVYERSVRVKFTAGAASIGVPQSDFTDEELTMTLAAVQFVASGAAVSIQGLGLAATNITWTAELKAYF